MKPWFTYKDSIRVLAAASAIILGALAMFYVSYSHRVSPPPDADIGGGIVYLSGMLIAYGGSSVLFASLLYIPMRRFINGLRTARLMTAAITVVLAAAPLAIWVLTNDLPGNVYGDRPFYRKESSYPPCQIDGSSLGDWHFTNPPCYVSPDFTYF